MKRTAIRPQKLRDFIALTAKGIGLALRASPPIGIAIGLLTLVSAALPPGIAYVGKLIIDSVVSQDQNQTAEMVVAEFGLIALMAMTQRSLFLCRTLLGNRMGINVNSMILEKAIGLELTQIENSEFYDKLTRARREASGKSLQMVTDTFQFFQNALTLLAYMSLLLSFSVWAVAALIVASIPATVAEMFFSNIGFKLYNWRSPDRRRMSYMEYVLATDSHAKELRVFGLGRKFLERYQQLAESFYREDSRLSKRRTIWVTLLSLLSSVAFYGCYMVIAIAAATGKMTLGNLTLYVVVFRQGQQAFQSCLAAIGGLYENNLYLSNLFEFLALPPSLQPSSENRKPQTTQSGIFFDDVSFKYPNRENFALQNISIHIPQGQSVAIVGSNGAGKSTLIKLLCGLYEPTSGNIFLDGKNLRDWPAEARLRRLSLVFQDFNKYQLTLQENIGVGDARFLDDSEHVQAAVARAGASELISSLPAGLKTSLGTWFKDGVEISGGQWQKVALSRAFMREEADILILDEPTAALDAEAESQAFERFHQLTLGKTSLIISHRFPIARLADHIIVIEQGSIQEQGTHDELVKNNGRYSQLFKLQAQGYL